MPSPFPGMNPYLEQDSVWQDFHDSFVPALRDALSPQMSPHYFVKIEEHLYIHEPPAEHRFGPRRARVSVEKQTFLEIRTCLNRELVGVIEVLSFNNNSPGLDREQYLAERAKLLHNTVHFVEVDLLRGGSRMLGEKAPSSDYCILVSHVDERPNAGMWPINLRERLPVIPVPLRPPHPEARLDLQAVLHLVYDRAYYKDHIYQGTPQPPLNESDAAWAARLIGNVEP